MCTLGAVTGRYLFKTRDLWAASDPREEIVSGRSGYRYVGVRGHATPLERGLNSGINEAGVAVAITFVDRLSLEDALETKTPRDVLVEEILGSCGDLAAALRCVADFMQTPLVGGNIVILTPQGGVALEQLYPRFALELITTPLAVRTNHFLNLKVPGPLPGNSSSQARYARMSELLEFAHTLAAPKLGQIKGMLGDHHGQHPICSHAGELHTVSAAIYDLHGRTLHYSAGPPCSTAWERYEAR